MDENDKTYEEKEKFGKSALVSRVVAEVNEKFGFPATSEESENSTGLEPLTLKDVEMIYDICRYEKAFRPEMASPWCAGFSEENLEVRRRSTYVSWKNLQWMNFMGKMKVLRGKPDEF